MMHFIRKIFHTELIISINQEALVLVGLVKLAVLISNNFYIYF